MKQSVMKTECLKWILGVMKDELNKKDIYRWRRYANDRSERFCKRSQYEHQQYRVFGKQLDLWYLGDDQCICGRDKEDCFLDDQQDGNSYGDDI